VLLAGPSSDSRTYSPCQSTAGWGAAIPGTQTFFGGASVQYVPGRYMKASGFDGGGDVHGLTQTLDGTPAPLAWTAGTTSALLPRTNHNLLLLPTGQALVTGGLNVANASAPAAAEVHEPQLWTPPTPGAANGTWSAALAPDPVRRGYHSTTLLLPDGRVLSAGGFYEN